MAQRWLIGIIAVVRVGFLYVSYDCIDMTRTSFLDRLWFRGGYPLGPNLEIILICSQSCSRPSFSAGIVRPIS